MMEKKTVHGIFLDTYKGEMELTVEKLVKYLRHKEIEKIKDNDILGPQPIGGLEILHQMLEKGEMTMSNFLAIRPAIEDPFTDYTIKIL